MLLIYLFNVDKEHKKHKTEINLALAVNLILLSNCSMTLHTTDTWPSTRNISSFTEDFQRSAKNSLETDRGSEVLKLNKRIIDKYYYVCARKIFLGEQ